MTRDFAPLLVVGFIGTRRGDVDRGPLIRIRPEDAAARLIADGDLVWIYGPRRHELAPAILDATLPRGGVVLRDVAGIAVSEIVRLVTRDVAQRPILTSRLT